MCTGISLKSTDNSFILSRTIEWGGSLLDSHYVIVPRGHQINAILPDDQIGISFTTQYGYVGLSVANEYFITEGINEEGLSVGLFYFPRYGQYPIFDPQKATQTISDFQVASWLLANFSTVEEVISNFDKIQVASLDPRSSTVHWRIADKYQREVVLEITNEQAHFYDNRIGILTNSPNFLWHITNLNNYINLYGGMAPEQNYNDINLHSFGVGSGMLGLPGDITPPSRFIQAAFYKMTAPTLPTAQDTILQSFHLMNHFDIPIGLEFNKEQPVTNIPSATQWTTVTDITHKTIYYRTMFNSSIRKINLQNIDFSQHSYTVEPLDKIQDEPIIDLI